MTEQFIHLLENLVQIPSPSREERGAVEYLVGWINDQGLAVEIDAAGNAVGSKGHGPKEIILLGHIDTFPGTPPVYRQDNILYGRGSVDAKGALCTFAAAVTQVDVPDGWRVTVVGAVEEEAATSKGARHILSQRLDQPPEFCIIGEPSRWDRITRGYKGRLLMDLTLRVPFSHSAGETALPAECAIQLWQAIRDYVREANTDRDRVTDQLDVSLRAINSEDQGAYGEVTLRAGFRLPPGFTPNEVESAVRNIFSRQPAEWEITANFDGQEEAYRGPKSSPLVRAFLKAIRANGGQPRFVVKTGTSDMNVVAPVWGCPTLAYGPGDSSLDHTPGEHIDLDEYLTAIDVLRQALTLLMA